MNKTKASRLFQLLNSDLKSYCLEQEIIRRFEFERMSNDDLNMKITLPEPLVVRSSSKDEDQEFSNAGKFDSQLNITRNELSLAIEKVFSSYESKNSEDEVLIQHYLADTSLSGVIFTADPNTGSSYFVINYHEGSDTTAITSGSENGTTLVIARTGNYKESLIDEKIIVLIDAVSRVEELLGEGPLDIEFAFKESKLYILQARPLSKSSEILDTTEFRRSTLEIQSKFGAINSSHPNLFGSHTILSVMADWNPAELIGVRPNQLSISLFRELISDNIWAYERSNFGYRNLRSFPLVVELGGHPYVDYRVSFNSLIPKDLSPLTGELLAAYYLKRLQENPHLHDKVEFEVYFGSWNLQTLDKLQEAGFTEAISQEIEASLRKLTSQIIKSDPYGLKHSLAKTRDLLTRFDAIDDANLPIISKIYWLIEDCKRHGTLPFAGIARCAFIATDLLRSLLEAGFLFKNDYDDFFTNLRTVTSRIAEDNANLDTEEFLDKYGHLRPGTFDINSLTYKENYEVYFKKNSELKSPRVNHPSIGVVNALQASGISDHLGVTSEDICEFIVESIQLREQVKFEFSKNISRVLEYLEILGSQYGFSRNEMGHVNISTILSFYKESGNEEALILEDIESGKLKERIAESLWLPPLIRSVEDIVSFKLSNSQPNYISQDIFSGEIGSLDGNLTGKAVLIESADPGFDWIFMHQIGALITCYGGANSHMAVRCKELGIPAAVGIGEDKYLKLTKARSVYLDCGNKVLEIVE